MKVYKTGEKKNPGITIIKISGKISEEEHTRIKKLSEFSDIAFIFPDTSLKTMSPKKFTSLYGGVFYYLTSSDDTKAYWELSDYLESLYDYPSIAVILGSTDNTDLENLGRLQISLIESSVFSSRDLSYTELQDIYMSPEKKAWWDIWRNYDLSGIYSRKVTEDKILFLRPITIRSGREYLEGHPGYLETFTDPKIFFPSLVYSSGGLHLNSGINETKI